jgi:SP family xylose:H+ symportor-like MFS transporter
LGTIALVFINIYIVVFELSLGPLLWVYLTEVMTEKGLSIAVAINLILTVTVALITPILFDIPDFGGWVFIICSGFCLLCTLFCIFMLKETKGLSGKQIAKLYSSVPIDADLLETDPINE